MLGQEHDLPGVVGVVRDLAVDGLQRGVRFARRIVTLRMTSSGPERVDRRKDSRPPFLPPLRKIGARGRWTEFEFLVAKAVGLFSVGGEEVGEKRERVLPAMCFTRRAMEFDSGSSVTNSSWSLSCAIAPSARRLCPRIWRWASSRY